MTNNSSRNVVLIHGLLMRPLVMRALALMLTRQGHKVYLYGYPTTASSFVKNAEHFARWLSDQGPTNIVGHSLGAVVTLCALQSFSSSINNSGRFVALAPPFNGSVVGRNLAKYKLWRAVLGESHKAWLERPLFIPNGWEIGVIAGNRSFGAGKFLTKLPTPNDGMVTVEETNLKNAKEMIVIKSTHTGLIFSPQVAKLTSSFLTTGSFAI